VNRKVCTSVLTPERGVGSGRDADTGRCAGDTAAARTGLGDATDRGPVGLFADDSPGVAAAGSLAEAGSSSSGRRAPKPGGVASCTAGAARGERGRGSAGAGGVGGAGELADGRRPPSPRPGAPMTERRTVQINVRLSAAERTASPAAARPGALHPDRRRSGLPAPQPGRGEPVLPAGELALRTGLDDRDLEQAHEELAGGVRWGRGLDHGDPEPPTAPCPCHSD